MSKDFIKNIVLEDYKTRGGYSPAKKIDLGGFLPWGTGTKE